MVQILHQKLVKQKNRPQDRFAMSLEVETLAGETSILEKGFIEVINDSFGCVLLFYQTRESKANGFRHQFKNNFYPAWFLRDLCPEFYGMFYPPKT